MYLNKYKFANVETADFQKSMEEASGKDLAWFFNQWIYKAGFPRIDVKQAYSAAGKKLTLTVTQVQKADSITPAVFILPMDVEIVTEGGAKTQTIKIDQRTQVFTLAVDGKPTGIHLDKNLKIPLKLVRIQPKV
jgi:aminopeptidase N